MNLRILKKLSKRAAPLLLLLGDERKQFPAEKNECYHGMVIRARKNYERMRSPHADIIRGIGHIKFPAKDGNGYISMWPPHHPLEGTMMVGGVSGYYEPEWDEECAYAALRGHLYYHFMTYDDEGEMTPTRSLRTPSEVFRAAQDMISELRVRG